MTTLMEAMSISGCCNKLLKDIDWETGRGSCSRCGISAKCRSEAAQRKDAIKLVEKVVTYKIQKNIQQGCRLLLSNLERWKCLLPLVIDEGTRQKHADEIKYIHAEALKLLCEIDQKRFIGVDGKDWRVTLQKWLSGR